MCHCSVIDVEDIFKAKNVWKPNGHFLSYHLLFSDSQFSCFFTLKPEFSTTVLKNKSTTHTFFPFCGISLVLLLAELRSVGVGGSSKEKLCWLRSIYLPLICLSTSIKRELLGRTRSQEVSVTNQLSNLIIFCLITSSHHRANGRQAAEFSIVFSYTWKCYPFTSLSVAAVSLN